MTAHIKPNAGAGLSSPPALPPRRGIPCPDKPLRRGPYSNRTPLMAPPTSSRRPRGQRGGSMSLPACLSGLSARGGLRRYSADRLPLPFRAVFSLRRATCRAFSGAALLLPLHRASPAKASRGERRSTHPVSHPSVAVSSEVQPPASRSYRGAFPRCRKNFPRAT